MDSRAVGGLGGAALGAVVGVLASGRAPGSVALSAALGAVLGSVCARMASSSQSSPSWHDETQIRTFEDVAREDAEFRAAAKREATDSTAEADALHRLLDGTSSAALVEACGSLSTTARLDAARAQWQPWKDEPRAKLGAAVQAAVDELDAPHLLPSGIEMRLHSGVPAASFGLLTLINAIDGPKAE